MGRVERTQWLGDGVVNRRYGRLLVYVFVDGENFNLELVRQGVSPYYTKYGLTQKYDKEFRETERLAREGEAWDMGRSGAC